MGSAVPHHHSCFSPPPAPPRKLCHLCNVSRLKHVWSETTSKPMRTGNFRFANDSVCHSCSSYLFFNGEEQRKEYGNAGNSGSSKIDTYRRNSFNTRKLPYTLIDVNVLIYVAQLATRGKLLLWFHCSFRNCGLIFDYWLCILYFDSVKEN
ncbi:hypothetical protein V6Z12_D01G210600 [Gossypium hirsutum]